MIRRIPAGFVEKARVIEEAMNRREGRARLLGAGGASARARSLAVCLCSRFVFVMR